MATVAGVEEPTGKERRLSASFARQQAIALQDIEMRVAAELDKEESVRREQTRQEQLQFQKEFHKQQAARKQAARERDAEVTAKQKEAAAATAKEVKAIKARNKRLRLKERSAQKEGPIARTEADVNPVEEAELRRLEDGDVDVSTYVF